MPPITDEYISIDNIRHKYTQSLIQIGINPDGMDLLEVIAALADTLNKTMAELWSLKVEMYNKIYNIEKEIK